MCTAQACEKCHVWKEKLVSSPPPPLSPYTPCLFSDLMASSLVTQCSGDHPACRRCLERGLELKYAAERRMCRPNKPKPHSSQCQIGPRSLPPWRDRNPANTLPPCLPFNARDCRFGVRNSQNRPSSLPPHTRSFTHTRV